MKQRKKRMCCFLLVLILLLVNSGWFNMDVDANQKAGKKPTKITLNYSKKNLAVGETLTLKVKSVKPEKASKNVTWSSSSKKIATVSKKGKVKAKKTGNVTITAKSIVSKKIVAKCKIRVYKATKKMKLNSKGAYELTVGQTQILSAKVISPKKGAAPIEWSSSDEKIAKVNSKGMVTAVAEGKATITGKSGEKKVKVLITVKAIKSDKDTGGQSEDKPSADTSSGEKNPGDKPSVDKPSGGTNSEIPPEDSLQEEISIPCSGTYYGMMWSIDADGDFLIEGEDIRTGNYDEVCGDHINLPDWSKYSNYIKTAVVKATNVKSMSSWFANCTNLTEVDLSELNTSNVLLMSFMFQNCASLTTLDVSSFDTGNVRSMGFMFQGCSSLTALDVSGFDTGNVTNMHSMFQGCRSLTVLDVSRFNTGNVTSMQGMFQGCSSLTALDVSGFDTRKVENMNGMFDGCRYLAELDVSNFDTGNVTNMSFMFAYCSGLITLNVGGFDTKNVKKMDRMFANCNVLEALDVSGFDTKNVTDMSNMFVWCMELAELDVSGFDTRNVTDMSYMFEGCFQVSELDLSGFDASKVTNMECMLCFGALQTVKVPINVKVECELPEGTWKDANGNRYTILPKGLTESIVIQDTKEHLDL